MQFITFGFACTPLYFVWEKVIGMHETKSLCLRALARLPVVIPIWFLAIIFPFYGPINSAVGALLVSFTVYIIPSLAHIFTYRSASARQVFGLLYMYSLIHILSFLIQFIFFIFHLLNSTSLIHCFYTEFVFSIHNIFPNNSHNSNFHHLHMLPSQILSSKSYNHLIVSSY